MTKKLFAAMLMLLVLFCCLSAHAEEDAVLYSGGGVIMRGYVKGADISLASASEQLDVAYARCTSPYLVLGEKAHWELGIEGGVPPYAIKVVIYQQDFESSGYYYGLDTLNLGNARQFTYTFKEPGRYFLKVTVTDKAGQYLIFESRVMETATKSDEQNAMTVSGKVNQIIRENITDSMSAYTRALVLHDWLIYHANYDYTYSNYEASGVLLYGSGVCESYARAYKMLCTAAGIECLVVSGTGNGGGHAWNLIKLNGSWYHVDCTWDDPGSGGFECHDYFCLTDEQMAVDHTWNLMDSENEAHGIIVPGADGGDFSEEEGRGGDADFTFADFNEYTRKFDAFIASHQQDRVTAYYTGTKNDVWEEFGAWVQKRFDDHYYDNSKPYNVWTYSRTGQYYWVEINWRKTVYYVRFEDQQLTLSVGETEAVKIAAKSPDNVSLTWTSSDPAIATVDQKGNITAVSGGTVVITAAPKNGQKDQITVTVLPPLQPDFHLAVSTVSNGVKVAWQPIPGITHYRVMRRYGGSVKELTATTDISVIFKSSELPSKELQQIFVIAERRVGSSVDASYTSDPVTFGNASLSFDLHIPSTITAIGNRTFYNADNLTSVSIPSSVTAIGNEAFANCSKLTAIRIPASVTSIGSNAFTGTPLNVAAVSRNSAAERYFTTYYPNVILIYE